MKNLFAYGTLMCQEIMLAVTGFPFRGVRGLLRDYHRGTIRGEVYPGIVPRRGGVVEYAPCSLLLALRSLLSAPCSILPFPFSMLYALCPMLYALLSTASSPDNNVARRRSPGRANLPGLRMGRGRYPRG